MNKIHWIDIQELAAVIFGLDTEIHDIEVIEEKLSEEFEISFDNFHKIVEKLVPMTPPAKTAILDKTVHGFVKDGFFIVKIEDE